MKKQIFLLLIMCSTTMTAQKTVTACGEYTYIVPENISLEVAKQIAMEKAQIQCIADEFGTTIGQSTSINIVNKNGKTDISNVSFGVSEVNGEWLGFVKEPEIETIYQDNTLVVHVSICGKIRETTNSIVDVDVQILCNGIDDRNERENFYEGDQLFISVNVPISGYLCIYMIDESLNAYNILPYSSNLQGAQYIEANKRNIFFSKHFTQDNEIVDEYAMSCSRDGEVNKFVIIFSPNKFIKPSDSGNNQMDLREISYNQLQSWMLKLRTKDKDMTIVNKSITINKIKR